MTSELVNFLAYFLSSSLLFLNQFHFPRFIELGSILEPGRPPKTDKSAILVDAVRIVTQLRGDAQKLMDSNSNLQEKIKELKVNILSLNNDNLLCSSFFFPPTYEENREISACFTKQPFLLR